MHPNVAAQIAEYRRQVLAPDFDGYERYFGCAAPPALRQFYELKTTLLAGVLFATLKTQMGQIRCDFIQYPKPMHESNWGRRYGREYFPFATNTDGYPLLIKPSSSESPVYADWADCKSIPDIEDLGFTLAEIVDSLSTHPGS